MIDAYTQLKERIKERKGVALILVMGLLSLMLVMGISFASLARTERKASANYIEGVKAKGLIYAAVHEAMNNLEQNAASFETVSGVKVYPADKVLYSRGGTAVSPEYLIDELFTAGSVAAAAFGTELYVPARAATNNMTWNQIRNVGLNRIEGEYCFIASNLSGLPDVNASFLNDPTRPPSSFPREDGLTALEVKHDNDFANTATGMDSMHDLISDNGANPVIRFESAGELDYLSSALFSSSNASSTFTYFSRYPLVSYIGSNTNVLRNITAKSVVDAEFSDFFSDPAVSFTSAEEASFRVAYNDYVDADESPSTLTDVSVERVPHISEVRATVLVAAAGANFNVTVTLDHEAAYLNSELPAANSFNLNAAYTIVIGYNDGTTATTATLTTPVVAPQPFTVTTLLSGGGYIAVGSGAYTVTTTTPLVIPSGTIDSIDVQVTTLEIQGTAKVDEVTPGVSIINLPTVSLGVGTHYVSNEVKDPRFNWMLIPPPLVTPQWVLGSVGNVTSVATLGSQNAATAAILHPTDPLGDTDLLTYSANDNLFTVGELGFIPFAPGQTIPLFTRGGRGAFPVYDYFTHFPGTHNEALNPNSEYTNAVANLFFDMPLNDFPGQGGATALSYAESKSIAKEIYDNRFYLNAGDIANSTPSLFDDSIVTVPTSGSMLIASENKRESVVRNSFGLLGTQNNFINMLLLVRAIKNGEKTAASKALVTVWRNPFPGSDGDHSLYIRSIRYLEE